MLFNICSMNVFNVAELLHLLKCSIYTFFRVIPSLTRARIKAKSPNPKNLEKTKKTKKTNKTNILGELWARTPQPPNVSGNIGFIGFICFFGFFEGFLVLASRASQMPSQWRPLPFYARSAVVQGILIPLIQIHGSCFLGSLFQGNPYPKGGFSLGFPWISFLTCLKNKGF